MNLQALLVENVPIPNTLDERTKRIKKPKVLDNDFVQDLGFEEPVNIKEEEYSFENDEAFIDVPTKSPGKRKKPAKRKTEKQEGTAKPKKSRSNPKKSTPRVRQSNEVPRLALDDALSQGSKEGWSEARIRAYKCIGTNPNGKNSCSLSHYKAYYFRFNKPGETQKTGPWSAEEKAMLLRRIEEFGVSGNWGLFSMTIPGRVGYQCLAMFRKLIQSGEVQAPPGYVMNANSQPKGSKPKKPRSTNVKKSKNVNHYSLDEFNDFSSDSEESVHYNNDEDEPLSPMNISEEDIILEQVETPRKRKKKVDIVEDTTPVVYSVPVVTAQCDISWLDICNLCGSAGGSEDMLFCCECGEVFHYFCLTPPIKLSPEKKKYWKCVSCKTCEVCRSAENEDQLIVCDLCDFAYHTYCIGLDQVPPGDSWVCNSHQIACKSCNVDTPGNDGIWTHNYSYCQTCGDLYSAGNYCTICSKVCKEEEKANMLHCSSCNALAHSSCRETNMSNEYTCESCVKREFHKLYDSDQRVCAFCHKKGDYTQGAADVDTWCHFVCALWSSECYENLDGGVVNVSKALSRVKVLKCSYCGDTGASIGCNFAKCPKTFHLECGKSSNCIFTQSKSMYCLEHTDQTTEPPIQPIVNMNRRLYIYQGIQRKNKKSTEIIKRRVGALTLIDLGSILPQVGFYDEEHIFPVNYCVKRRFWSIEGEDARADYTCKILKVDDFIVFQITCQNFPELLISSHTPQECVDQLLLKVNAGRQNLQLTVNKGLGFFGLNDSWIVNLIEELPGAVKCRGYKFQFVNPDKLQIAHDAPRVLVVPTDEEVADNPTGCARTEAYVRKKHRKKSNALYPLHKNASLMLYSNRKAGESFRFESDLPAAMKYRQWREKKPKLIMVKSAIHEFGVIAAENVEPNEMIIEYIGEIIGRAVSDKREREYDSRGIGTYMFKINDQEIIDATFRGNLARFVNHSCDPNAYTRVVEADGKNHIMIIAKKFIAMGEEITYDYMFDPEQDKIPCLCGTENCRGFLN